MGINSRCPNAFPIRPPSPLAPTGGHIRTSQEMEDLGESRPLGDCRCEHHDAQPNARASTRPIAVAAELAVWSTERMNYRRGFRRLTLAIWVIGAFGMPLIAGFDFELWSPFERVLSDESPRGFHAGDTFVPPHGKQTFVPRYETSRFQEGIAQLAVFELAFFAATWGIFLIGLWTIRGFSRK